MDISLLFEEYAKLDQWMDIWWVDELVIMGKALQHTQCWMLQRMSSIELNTENLSFIKEIDELSPSK